MPTGSSRNLGLTPPRYGHALASDIRLVPSHNSAMELWSHARVIAGGNSRRCWILVARSVETFFFFQEIQTAGSEIGKIRPSFSQFRSRGGNTELFSDS